VRRGRPRMRGSFRIVHVRTDGFSNLDADLVWAGSRNRLEAHGGRASGAARGGRRRAIPRPAPTRPQKRRRGPRARGDRIKPPLPATSSGGADFSRLAKLRFVLGFSPWRRAYLKLSCRGEVARPKARRVRGGGPPPRSSELPSPDMLADDRVDLSTEGERMMKPTLRSDNPIAALRAVRVWRVRGKKKTGGMGLRTAARMTADRRRSLHILDNWLVLGIDWTPSTGRRVTREEVLCFWDFLFVIVFLCWYNKWWRRIKIVTRPRPCPRPP